ncbi:MAG: hypothetical protein IJE12_03010 [Prevotella sp.]|nr:hypothetical protein [Prevotella sp.]
MERILYLCRQYEIPVPDTMAGGQPCGPSLQRPSQRPRGLLGGCAEERAPAQGR